MKIKHWSDFKYLQGKIDSVRLATTDSVLIEHLTDVSSKLEALFLEIANEVSTTTSSGDTDVKIDIGPVSYASPEKLKKKGTQEELIEKGAEEIMGKHLND